MIHVEFDKFNINGSKEVANIHQTYYAPINETTSIDLNSEYVVVCCVLLYVINAWLSSLLGNE